MTNDRTELLLVGMGLLVPLWIARVASWPDADRQAAAVAAADLISTGADELRETNPRRRDLPQGTVTSAIARGLALLAYQPGGVTWAGSHWCTTPHEGCPGPSAGWIALVEQGATW
ncbi:hypothetical protein [Micrococcus luteus]|uniref:hypothetical protein n=1 Tax=Micrococcus luteus TaxID=1270 RepID=UPI00331F0515